MAAPALALIEFSSIARGTRVVDDVAKKAPISIHTAEAVSNGKFLLIFHGEVGAVEESFREGVAVGGGLVVNKLLLAQVHPMVVAALDARMKHPVDALAIVELGSMSTTISAADAAVKAADVALLEIRLGKGIGGKGYFTLTGSHADVVAAVDAAEETARREEFLIESQVVPRPSDELVAQMAGRR